MTAGGTTLIIAGAGMSVKLGLLTTNQIDEIVQILLDSGNEENPTSIDSRLEFVREKRNSFDHDACDDIKRTLTILLDGDGARTIAGAYDAKDVAVEKYIQEYSTVFPGRKEAALRQYLSYLFQTYDLTALKSLIFSLSQVTPKDFNIVDVLTTVQHSIDQNISIPTKEIFPDDDRAQIYYCDRKRLVGAMNAYKLLFYKIFKHLLRQVKTEDLKAHEDFCFDVARDCSGLETLDDLETVTNRENYLSNIGFLTYNWDPIFPFLLMKSLWRLNRKLLRQSVAGRCKKIYADFGVPFIGIKLSGKHSDSAVYSFGEDTAFLINAFTRDFYLKDEPDIKSKLLIKIIKLFVPHGLINMRICPRCQNGLFIIPEDIGTLDLGRISRIFVSDPIPSLEDCRIVAESEYRAVQESYIKGIPDELICPLCNHPVHFEHSFLEIQSIIKGSKPPAVNKIQFDYAEFFSKAEHIISLGYSFPKDDIINSVFLKNMKIRKDELGKDCKLTFFGSLQPGYSAGTCYGYEELSDEVKNDIRQTYDTVSKLFKQEHMRFNFMGIPDVFKKVPLKDMLIWSESDSK